MPFYTNIWKNFVEYVSTFEPYKPHKDKLIFFLGNSGNPPTGFKDRSLAWYNPVSNRFKFNCGYRVCCNV
jgi:hypothetical protein